MRDSVENDSEKNRDEIVIGNNIAVEQRGCLLKRLSEMLKFTKYGAFNKEREKVIAAEKGESHKKENNVENENIERDTENYSRYNDD